MFYNKSILQERKKFVKNIQYYFNPEDGSSLCTITINNHTFVGTAQCADADRDMMSEKTGCEIAHRRAAIYALRHERETIKSELMGLKKYYHTVYRSKYYQENGYMENMLKRQIEFQEDRLNYVKDLLDYNRESLKNYLTNKAAFYAQVRKNRNGQN